MGVDVSLGLLTRQQKYQIHYAYVDVRNRLTNKRLSQRPYHQLVLDASNARDIDNDNVTST